MNNGWISIHRRIQEHWLWSEKRTFSNLEAWIDILMSVNHSDKKVLIGNILLDVKRGDSIMSLDSWGKRWNWNKSKVRRFFSLLEKDEMIVTKNERKTTRLTVCKYDSYQDIRNDNETQVKRKRNASETQVTPNNNDNNINNENNENNNIIYPSFEDFWDLYNKKVDKSKCLKKWEKLNQTVKEKIIDYLPNYINSTKDIQFRKNPITFLNNESWNNEITTNLKTNKDENKRKLVEYTNQLREQQQQRGFSKLNK